MSSIIEEFKTLFEKKEIEGLYKWSQNYDYCEREILINFIRNELSNIKPKDLSKLDDFNRSIEERTELAQMAENGFREFDIVQQTIIYLILEDSVGILNLKNTQIDIDLLDGKSIDEVILFYNLKNPQKRYKEIRDSINSPQSFLTRIPYSIINGLYKKGKVPFDREIFVACLIRFNVWHSAQYNKELSPENAAKFDTFFPQDKFTLDILLAIFEMELGVNGAFYLDREHNIAAVIFALIKNGKYTKIQIQQKIFEAYNNSLLKQSTQSWMKNIYNDLELTLEENIKQQEQIIGLLLNDVNLIANHSITLIKQMVKSPKFSWQLLIQSLEGIVYREKMNGGLKTLLDLLFKKLQQEPKLLEACCLNLAPIFLQTDNKVQMSAKKIYELLPASSETVKEALLPFVDTMHSEIKKDLKHLVDDEVTTKILLEPYKQEEYKFEALNENDQLNYIESVEDFIFLTSKVLKSSEFTDYEMFIEGLVRFFTIKETHFSELKPALKQAERFLDKYSYISNRMGIHHQMVALLIVTWLKPDYLSVEEHIQYWENELAKDPDIESGKVYISNEWLTHFKQFTRVRKLAKHIRENKTLLPFLSISTHANGQIHSEVFLERLQQYENANQTPEQGDFDLALCRLNREMKVDFSQNSQSEYRKIVNYLFNKKAVLNPQEIEKLESSWLTAFALKNPTQSLHAILEYRNHKKEFFTSQKTWEWSLVEINKESVKFDLQIDYITNNELKSNGMPSIAPMDNHLSSYLDIKTFFVADASHWFHRNPFYLEVIYLARVNQDFRWLDYLEADEIKSIMAIVLESAKNPKPIGKAGYLFLVLSLFCKEKSIRIATLDWLMLLIEHKYLDINLFKNTVTRLLANQHEHFVPIPRVCEQFDQLLQMKGVYVEILEQVLEDIIPEMNAENLPRGFSKLLHYYFEVLTITTKNIRNDIVTSLEKMRKITAVKKVVDKILEEHI